MRDGRLLLVQGVRNLYTMDEATGEGMEGERAKVVLIGTGVEQECLSESLWKTIAWSQEERDRARAHSQEQVS